MKSKQLDKGIRQLTDEGVAQLFTQQPGNKKIVGCVGTCSLDAIRYRLEHEYGARCAFRPIQAHKACWLTSDDQEALDRFVRVKSTPGGAGQGRQQRVHGSQRLHAGPGEAGEPGHHVPHDERVQDRGDIHR